MAFERTKALVGWIFGGSHEQLREEALTRSERADVPLDLYQEMLNFSKNPDALLDDLNKDGQIYKDMMRDAVVKSSVNRQILSVISQDYVVQAQDPEDEQQQKIAEFVEWTLLNFQQHPDPKKLTISSFRSGLLQMCDAVAQGYSITEILFGAIKHAPRVGRIGIVALKGKDTIDVKLKFDKYLNIIGLTNTADGRTDELEPLKFIIFPWMQLYANAYGTSSLQAAYRPWWIKKFLYKVWPVALEKFVMPTVVGKHPANWKKAQKDALMDAMRKMQQDNAILMQEDGLIEFLENAVTNGADGFIAAIEALNKEILIAIEGASMHIIESRLTGSRNVGLVSADQADIFVWFLARSLEEIINGQLIPKLVDANFKGAVRPKFQFVDPGDKDLVKDTQIDEALQRMGLGLSKSYLYEHYGRPEPKPGEEVVQPSAPASAPAAPPPADPLLGISEPETGNGRNRLEDF